LLTSPSPIPQDTPTHSYLTPRDSCYVKGVIFDVNFNHMYASGERLEPSQLGYAVRYKGSLSGGRQLSNIWAHGLHLQYTKLDGIISKV
jgi:hypothetical protein